MNIALASDHAGFEYKQALVDFLNSEGYEALDLGTNSADSVDYPDYGFKLGEAIEEGKAQFGIAVCGSGIGISIAVNRVKSARCALCTSEELARLSRAHNDANVLALGARIISLEEAKSITLKFLTSPFEGDRHQRRVDKLSK